MTRAKKGASKASRITTKLFIKPKSVKALPAPEPPKFETLPVDAAQCRKAVHALVAHAKQKVAGNQKSDLLASDDDEMLWLAVTVKRMSPKDSNKSIRIALPNPLMDPRKNPVCLLVKDPQREYKDLLEGKNVKFISRVIGLEKLQGKFKPFEARRQLMKEHDLFLVDDRILPEMPRVLGKSWLQTKKSPIPVTLKRVDLKGELERAISSTYLRVNRGTSLAIKLGSLANHSLDQLYENLLAVIPHLAVRVPMGGWDNVQSLNIKTTTSASLPIWTCSLAEEGEGDAKGRFYIPDMNEAEIQAAKKAKEDKEKRIKEKKARKLAQKDEAKLIEAGPSSAAVDVEEDGAGADKDPDEDQASDAEEPVDEIDESSVQPEVQSSPKRVKQKASKGNKNATLSGESSDRKKVSSTSKKLKGMDGIKGFPAKAKEAKAA